MLRALVVYKGGTFTFNIKYALISAVFSGCFVLNSAGLVTQNILAT
jgi:hypothetical protein